MTRRDKLINRLLQVPADFSWDELVRVLAAYGYEEQTASGGSHRSFYNAKMQHVISGMVKPHNAKHVKRAYLRKVITQLGLDDQ